MASVPATAPLITDKDTNKLKVIYVLNHAGQPVLLTVYKHLKPYDDSISIEDHLPKAIYKKEFDRTMKHAIEHSDNSGKDYDISLLIKCIRVLSSHYEPHSQYKWTTDSELECKCQKLVTKRNDTFHTFSGLTNSEMTKEFAAIELLVMDILESLKVRFPTEIGKIDDIKKENVDKINTILVEPLGKSEIKFCLFLKYMKILRDEIPKYKDTCKSWGKLEILDFLLKSSTFHDIRLLFTDIIVEKSDSLKSNTPVDYKDILTLASNLAILLISSEAGGGKTTIFRYVINDWGEGASTMSEADYDLIFPMLFRDPHTSSVEDLISDLLPSIKKSMDTDDIMSCIKDPSQKILFFCDGYDEKNEKSIKVFDEICNLKEKYRHIRVVVTSRPEAVEQFLRTHHGSILSIEHLKLLGIPESKRGEFLKRYHDEMSDQSSDDLLHFFDNCSDRHKELYRLPINLVILAFLWVTDPDKAKTVKSAAGLYEALVDILNQKLISRILKSYPVVMIKLNNNLNKLKRLIEMFKAKLYNESLVSISKDRMYIDKASVTELDDFCDDKGLPVLELKGAFLLSKIEWENSYTLTETLEFPHKGFLDYFSAKCIESKLIGMEKNKDKENVTENSNRGNVIKDIILQTEGKHFNNFQKYQNILQLLGGILALNDDSSLVDKYGNQIIDLLIETGVRNNVQWYDVFSDLNLNPTAAEKFGKLISPNLILDNFTIKDADVEVLSTLLKYVDINKVDLQISNTTPHIQLPELINILRNKKCQITGNIAEITDKLVDSMNSGNTPFAKINADAVMIKNDHGSLPFLSHINTKNCNLQRLWREPCIAAPNMSGCGIGDLWTAVNRIQSLPTTVENLWLGLLMKPDTVEVRDPGLGHLKQHCTQLKRLGVHLRANITTELLRVRRDSTITELYISQLADEHHLQCAVNNAKKLLPHSKSGYYRLVLPQCSLRFDQISDLMGRLAGEGITIGEGGVEVSCQFNYPEKQQLENLCRHKLNCPLQWRQDEEELTSW